MRSSITVVSVAAFLAAVFLVSLGLAPVAGRAQDKAPPAYKLEFDRDKDVSGPVNELYKGKDQLVLTVSFAVLPIDPLPPDAWKDHRILIKEYDKEVMRLRIPPPAASEEMTLVFAMDESGSMNEFDRIRKAREAAAVFYNQLPAKAYCGLILFDHLFRAQVPPNKDRGDQLELIKKTEPAGGTAYLDAAMAGIRMVSEAAEANKTKGKAVVVMTDGVDLNSRHKLEEVIKEARARGVPVYTIGIGEPGKDDPVTTVLTVDTSGSMLDPANDTDKVSKIDALKVAAARFVEIMRKKARTTILQFSDTVKSPEPFSADKHNLTAIIKGLKTGGETAFLDAAYTAVMALAAQNPDGKRAVVLMTDGIDNSSRRRVEEVIDRAKEAKIPIYMLGLGRKKELDEKTMEKLAKGTDGKYYHAEDEKKLLEIFENLSIKLHDDGIDEESLKKLAKDTGGQYHPVKDVQQLKFILGEVQKNVQHRYPPQKFADLNPTQDGSVRPIKVQLVRVVGGGENDKAGPGGEEKLVIVQDVEVGRGVGGVVVAQMNYLVYLVLLGLLAVLLALPPTLRRLKRSSAG